MFYRAVGCDTCRRTGYRGRVGIYEIMAVTAELRRLIAQRGAETQLREAAIAAGMISLGEDGLSKVRAGLTTPQELLRVVTEVRPARGGCEACGTRLSADFTACPQCGRPQQGGCPHCGRSMQAEWRFCPYCAKPLAARRSEPDGGFGRPRLVPELPPAGNPAP
jgi:hypothetical protein